jgi:sialate O-acetylesterase
MTFADVLVGEVWIASGQSNMSRTVDMETPSEVVAADRAAREIPHLPLLTVSRFPTDARPSGIGGRWEIARADTAGRFSAVGFHFGRAVHRAEHVPVGVIQASVSGAPLAAWLGPDALAALARIEDQPISSIERCWALTLDAGDHRARAAVYEPIYDRWRREVALPALARREPFEPPPDAPLGSRFHPWAPSTLFHGMIAPLAPFTLRGVIWWQGEGNATRPNEYAAAFPRMIESWRALWGQGSFPFLFVQLGGTREDRASLREVQRQTLDRVPATGMAISIDVPTPDGVHAARYAEVGDRLAKLALAVAYGRREDSDADPFTIASRFDPDRPPAPIGPIEPPFAVPDP